MYKKLTRRGLFLWFIALFGYKVVPVQTKPKLDPVLMGILDRVTPMLIVHDLLGPHVIRKISSIEIISQGSGYNPQNSYIDKQFEAWSNKSCGFGQPPV